MPPLLVRPGRLLVAALVIANHRAHLTGRGLAPTTAALAVVMQGISFIAVLVFFRIFGTRHFRGTYIL